MVGSFELPSLTGLVWEMKEVGSTFLMFASTTGGDTYKDKFEFEIQVAYRIISSGASING